MIVQLVVATGNRAGQIIPVTAEKFIVGRADDCHLKPKSDLISRYHCAILINNNDDVVVVRDLGSKNGVRLNGEKVSTEHKLQNGDWLAIGPLEFYVHIAGDETMTGLPQIDAADMNASWIHQPDDNEDSDAPPTVLLEQLKSLNSRIKTEAEPPVLDLLKKFQ